MEIRCRAGEWRASKSRGRVISRVKRMNEKTKVPLKASLPLLMGFVNTALVVWDQHNERVILHQGQQPGDAGIR